MFIKSLINIILLLALNAFFYKFYHKNKVLFILFSLMIIFVLIINKFLINPSYFPDQFTYFDYVRSIRNLDFSILENYHLNVSDRTFFSSILLSIFPLPFVDQILDVALLSKGFFLLMVIYLYQKKYVNNASLIFLLFTPSILLYSSLALKETLIYATCVLSFILFYEKRIFYFIIISIALFFLKPIILTILITSFVIAWISEKIKNKFNVSLFKIYSIAILIALLVALVNIDLILVEINKLRYSQWANDLFPPYLYTEINKGNLLYEFFLQGVLNFYFSPYLSNFNNIFKLVQFMENIFLIAFIIYNFNNTIKAKYSMFPILFLLFFSLLLGGLVFNSGTLTRYKVEIVLVYVVLSNYLKIKNSNK